MVEGEGVRGASVDTDGIRGATFPMDGMSNPFVKSQLSSPPGDLEQFASFCGGDERNRLLREENGRLRGLVEMMEPSFTLQALEPGRLLDGRADDMDEAMRSASWVSLMFTSQPMTAALSKWQAKVFLLLLGAFYMSVACLFVAGVGSEQFPKLLSRTSKSQIFRFSALQLRDRTRRPDIATPGIKSFGLAINGVPLEERLTENMTTFSDGPDLYLTFPSPVEFNGWFIVTSDDDPSKDAVAYELKCLRGKWQDVASIGNKLAQEKWVVVGSSGWYYSGGARTQVSSNQEYRNENLPLCRGCREIYDYSVRPLGYLIEVGSFVCMALFCWAGSIAAMMNRQRTGRIFVGFGFGLMAFSSCVISGWSLAVGRVDGAVGPMLLSPSYFLWAIMFIFREQYTLPSLLIAGVWIFFYGIISTFVTGISGFVPLYLVISVIVLPLTSGFALVLYYKRWELKKKTWQLVKPDLNMYSEIWANFLRSGDAANVERLEELCRTVANRTDDFRGERYARQLNRCRTTTEDKALIVIDGLPRALDDTGSRMASPAHGRLSWIPSDDSIHSNTSGRCVQGGDVQRHRAKRKSVALKSRNAVAPMKRTSSTSSGTTFDDGSPSFRGMVGNDGESIVDPAFWGEVVSSDWLEDYKPSHILGPEYLFYTTVVGTVDEASPVKSLDQLYLQASGVSPVLREHALKWSQGSDALLPFVRPSPDGTRMINTFESHAHATEGFVSISSGEAKRGGIKWAKLKSPERASEKAMRSYRGDMSRLLDICRQQIVFRSMGDLVRCLEQIAGDGVVRVVRVKNRMSRGYDANSSMGYRDVQVNLRFKNEHLMRFGLETHVCEVQLVLLEFAKIKTEEGHKRYVEFRNGRGE